MSSPQDSVSPASSCFLPQPPLGMHLMVEKEKERSEGALVREGLGRSHGRGEKHQELFSSALLRDRAGAQKGSHSAAPSRARGICHREVEVSVGSLKRQEMSRARQICPGLP